MASLYLSRALPPDGKCLQIPMLPPKPISRSCLLLCHLSKCCQILVVPPSHSTFLSHHYSQSYVALLTLLLSRRKLDLGTDFPQSGLNFVLVSLAFPQSHLLTPAHSRQILITIFRRARNFQHCQTRRAAFLCERGLVFSSPSS